MTYEPMADSDEDHGGKRVRKSGAHESSSDSEVAHVENRPTMKVVAPTGATAASTTNKVTHDIPPTNKPTPSEKPTSQQQLIDKKPTDLQPSKKSTDQLLIDDKSTDQQPNKESPRSTPTKIKESKPPTQTSPEKIQRPSDEDHPQTKLTNTHASMTNPLPTKAEAELLEKMARLEEMCNRQAELLSKVFSAGAGGQGVVGGGVAVRQRGGVVGTTSGGSGGPTGANLNVGPADNSRVEPGRGVEGTEVVEVVDELDTSLLTQRSPPAGGVKDKTS